MPTIAIADAIAGSEVLVGPRARARRPSRVGGVAFGGDFEPWGSSSEWKVGVLPNRNSNIAHLHQL